MSKMETFMWGCAVVVMLLIMLIAALYIDWKLEVLIEAIEAFFNRCECPTSK